MTTPTRLWRLRSQAMADAAEHRAVADQLAHAATDLALALAPATRRHTSDTWASTVADTRRTELADATSRLGRIDADIGALAARLRAVADTLDDDAAWYAAQYWVACECEGAGPR